MDLCPIIHEKFLDCDKCLNLIEELQNKLDPIGKDETKCQAEAEKLVKAFKKLIDPYQEQPELLDPYLTKLIEKLTFGLDDFNISSNRYHVLFKFLYQLIKVVGFKSIAKKFPHETDKLLLLVQLLSKEDPQDKINWQTRYVLTVWLSIVILTPFDLVKFESNSADQSISDKIYSTLMRSLRIHDSCQHVTAFCLAKFFSRPDVIESDQHLSKFISVALNEIANVKIGSTNSMDDIQLIGCLRTLAYMFKFLPRKEMKLRCNTILDVTTKLDVEKINRELVNHLIIKLVQRAGLTLLSKPLAVWRYKRGSRILGHITHIETTTDTLVKPASEQVAENSLPISNNEIDLRSAEYLESIFSILFVAAQNSQTKIRWSAAKGIARLANRLSRERASDVIDMVMTNFFNSTSTEFSWHGGCLTLAEMSRSGLILEEKLTNVTRIVSNAIIYDKIKGSFAVGAHVREAACYVCWAIARTYEDHLLQPYISSISINLLCTMLFDRELQCRRAASATFQELVGRQGTFNEEGINILTNVDYQNVSQRQLTYLKLALQVASYGEKYSRPFVQHLLEKKISHWDVQIRRLASDSLSALMLHSNHDYVRSEVLPKLIDMSDQNVDNNAKHGAILGLAKAIRGLVPLQFEFNQKLIDFVGCIVKKCEKQLKSKQQAANFIEAIGCVVSSAEAASFNYEENSDVLKQWESIALMALDNDNSSLRDIGSEALLTLYKTYFVANKTWQDRILTILNKSLSSASESSRCGGLKALSKLSQQTSSCLYGQKQEIRTDADTPDIILMSLISYIAKETFEKSLGVVFAQAKAEACEALVNFVRYLDKSRLIVSSNLIRAGYDALLEKAEDYTFDKRGDIGVVVRRAAIKALQELTLHLLSIGVTSIFDSDRVAKIIGKTLQQAVSYNNSARELAAIAFYRLIGSDLPKNTIPHKAEVLALFDKYEVNDEFNWRDNSTPIFVNLLAKIEYSSDLWIGLLPSVGQVSDMCAKQFRDALSDYILSLSDFPKEREQMFKAFLETLEREEITEKLLTSGLIVAEYLLTQGLMNDTSEEFQKSLAKFCWGCKGSGELKRLISKARVLSSMLQFTGAVQRDCLEYCLALLVNGYAKVRVHTAEQLYLSIMTYQSDLEENLIISKVGDSQEVGQDGSELKGVAIKDGEKARELELDLSGAMELLSQTNWSEPLGVLRPVRDQICACLALKPRSLQELASGGAVAMTQKV